MTKHTGLTPKRLRCESLADPLGIDVARPRLSWIVESAERAQKQTAYRILVARSEELLNADRGDLWDSGKIRSGETAHIVYAGQRCGSRRRCFWKLRVWDGRGKASDWSRPARWAMGLLRERDWRAVWIGCDAPLKSTKARKTRYGRLFLPPPRYLRKGFTLTKPVHRATLYATALGLCDVHINGRRAGEDYFTPGWTDYDARVYYRTYDVTGLLRRGENAVGALLADGWYAGYVGWQYKRDHYGKRTRVRAQLEVEYADGTTETVATDRSWRAATGPLLEADFLMGETYDARREMPGWDAPGFDDGKWNRVNVTSRVKARAQAHPAEPVRKFAELHPVRITEPRKGAYVIDMGRNFAGFVRLKLRAPRGRRIVLRFAERLNPDGTIYVTNLRKARATDTYVCRGGGTGTWEPRFTFHGFQYVEVRGLPRRPRRDAVTGVALSSDTPVAGSFKCSDKTANRLYGNIVWTQRANFIDIPTDCPQRDERLGWTGDAQAFIRTATYNADVGAFFTKWLVDVADAQRPDGAFTHVAPCKLLPKGGAAAWGDAGVICPWTLYQVYGDKDILRRHYKAMARWIAYCRKHSDNLLRPDEGFGDWLSVPRRSVPKDVVGTAYFAYSTGLMARIAAVCGQPVDAARYRRLFGRIKRAFNKAYVAADGSIKSGRQTVYVLALAFDLLPKAKRPVAVARLIEAIKSKGWHLSTGFLGTKDLMTVLTRIGRPDVAYRLFHNDTYPSWGFSIRHGATSMWERWNGWTPEQGFGPAGMNSFSHYAYGAVAEWMFKTIGGIDTDGPGFKRVNIRPLPGCRLRSARVRYDSIRGPIETAWTRRGHHFRLNVTLPANTVATVHVPAADERNVTESGRPAHRSVGVEFVGMEDGAALYRIGSGAYAFRARR